MQIVIDIPEELKKDFELEQWTAFSCVEMKKALENGKILPKGHGRLIDADELEPDTEWDDYEDGFISYSRNQIKCAIVIIEADITNKDKITYQPVDDYKECNFYKDGKEKDLSEKLDDYYSQPYRDNPFREGRMSGLWGEYEYYCPKCNLEITKVFYDNEHIRVGDCSKCPKCKESD
jgi:hypothetical protein